MSQNPSFYRNLGCEINNIFMQKKVCGFRMCTMRVTPFGLCLQTLDKNFGIHMVNAENT